MSTKLAAVQGDSLGPGAGSVPSFSILTSMVRVVFLLGITLAFLGEWGVGACASVRPSGYSACA